MPIQDGKYVTPAWQNGSPPAITAEELTAIGQSIEQNESDIQDFSETLSNDIQNVENKINNNYFTKSQTLSTNTSQSLNISSNPIPDNAFVALKNLVDTAQNTANTAQATGNSAYNTAISRCRLETGYYIGSGTYGQNNQNSLSFSFDPKLIFIGANMLLQTGNNVMLIYQQTKNNGVTSYYGSGEALNLEVIWSGNTVKWYTSLKTPDCQLNIDGVYYYYVALG